MYCPKCSQSQLSDEMRFCSRCGFPLTTVALLLDNNGIIPDQQKSIPQTRSRIATESLILTIFSWGAALLATFWFDHGGPLEFVAKLAAIVFVLVGLIGLFRFLYAFLFLPSSREYSVSDAKPNSVAADSGQAALPPAQPNPVSEWTRSKTREMVSQPSVTERTTQLLDGNEKL